MLGWSLLFLVFQLHYFSNCNAQITIPIDSSNSTVNGSQFEIKDSVEFLKLPVPVYTSACQLLANRKTFCARFIPERQSRFLSAGFHYFNGNLTVQNTLTVNYKPENLTNELIFVNNLTETLKKGFNLDREISDHFNSILQTGGVQLFVTNISLDLRGVLDSSTYSTMFINTLIANSTTDWFTMRQNNQFKSEFTQIQNYSATQSKIYLDLNITSKTKIILNNANLIKPDTLTPVLLNAEQIFRYENCESISRLSYSNAIFAIVILTIFAILKWMRPKTLIPVETAIELRVFDEATLKLKAEEFFLKYPIGSVESRELDKVTALLPQTMVDHPIAISMIPPREIADFDCFGDVLPVVEIGQIDDQSGSQTVKFTGGVECNVQCNTSLVPRLLDTELQNDTLENDQLPPPAFYSIDSSNEHLECFYQVRIVALEENSPNLAIGFVTGLYPPFRLPGLCDKSIAFHCHDSTVRFCGETVPFPEIEIYEGDTLGIGYYLQPPTERDTNPESILKNVHFYFTFEKKRYEREFVLENMDIGLVQPSIGSRSDCEVEVLFGPLYTAFAPERLY